MRTKIGCLKLGEYSADRQSVFWMFVIAASIVIGFLVARFSVPLVVFGAWLAYYLVSGRHHSPDDDVSGIGWFVLMTLVVGGTTVGVLARYVAHWTRRLWR